MRISVEEVARRLGIHPFEVVRHLTTHRQSMPGFTVESDMVSTVMGWAGLENWWEDDPSDAISSARGDLSTSRGVGRVFSPTRPPHTSPRGPMDSLQAPAKRQSGRQPHPDRQRLARPFR